MSKIRVFENFGELNEAAAEMFCEIGEEAIAQRGRFTVALAGGSTPRELYRLVSSDEYRNRIDWNKVFLFFGDERFVPLDHSDSNYQMTKENLLDRIEISPSNIFPWNTMAESETVAAEEYEKTLQNFFGESLPRFDLILLGIGTDGHTASLFPYTRALNETNRLTAANYVEKLDTTRLTFVYPLINNARQIAFLVSGDEKAPAIKAIIEGELDPDNFPAQAVFPKDGELTWFLDAASARLLIHKY